MPLPHPAPETRLEPIEADGRPSDAALPVPANLSPMLDHTRALYDRTGYHVPWISYLAVSASTIVGGGAFVAPPQDGAVEIAYFTLAEHQGRGHAGRTAAELVAIAHDADPQMGLWAKTLPDTNASTRILARLGFHRDGTVEDHEIGTAWRWRLPAGMR